MTLAERLAAFAARLEFEDIPAEVIAIPSPSHTPPR